MAESVVNYFSHPQTGLLIDSLEECGVILTGETSVQGQKQPLAGKIFVLTGDASYAETVGSAGVDRKGGRKSDFFGLQKHKLSACGRCCRIKIG